MMNEMNYSYDAKFEGNILIVGRNGCGKTTFVQKLAKKNVCMKCSFDFYILKTQNFCCKVSLRI